MFSCVFARGVGYSPHGQDKNEVVVSTDTATSIFSHSKLIGYEKAFFICYRRGDRCG